jgi:hypothetical protein
MNKCPHAQIPLAKRYANAACRSPLREPARLQKRAATARSCASEIEGVQESDARGTFFPASSAAKSSIQTDFGKSIARLNVVTWLAEAAAGWFATLAKRILSMCPARLPLADIALGHVS